MLPARADIEMEDDPFPNLRRVPERGPRLRRWLPGLISIGALGVFAGILSYAYVLGGRGADGVALPVVQADQRPIKVRPENPGGMAVPFQDKEIYSRLGQPPETGAQGPKVERLLPPPEAPLPRPASAPPPPSPPIPSAPDLQPPADAVVVVAPPAKPPVDAKPEAWPEPRAPASAAPSQAPTIASNAAKPPVSGASPGAAPTTSPPATALEKPSSVAPASNGSANVASAATSAAAVTPAAGAPGAFRIQLGALKSDSDAKREGERLKRRHGDVLGPLDLSVQRADLGAKGIYYRIQLGPLASADAAGDVCRKMSARKVGCLVVRP